MAADYELDNVDLKILEILLERLFASLTRGPALNCWPGRSRQRFDLASLELIGELPPAGLMHQLLSQGQTECRPEIEKLPPPPKNGAKTEYLRP